MGKYCECEFVFFKFTSVCVCVCVCVHTCANKKCGFVIFELLMPFYWSFSIFSQFYWGYINNWHTALYKFKVYSILIWLTYIMKWLLQQVWWTPIKSYTSKIRDIEKNFFFSVMRLLRFTLGTTSTYNIQGEWVLSHFSHVRLCDPMNCSPPGSSVHGILQARTLEWVAFPFSRGCSRPRDWNHISCIAGGFFTTEPPRKPIRLTELLHNTSEFYGM